MKAVILAAGKSARLLPLNKNIHQCLLKVNNKTILERQIESLSSAGIEDISLVSGYHSEKVEEVCNKLGIKTFFNPFFELSGTAMTLWIAKSELKNGCYLILSDKLFDSEIIKGFLKTKGDICLTIKRGESRREADKVVDENGVIKKIMIQADNGYLKDESAQFVGIAKFSKKGAERLIETLNHLAKTDLLSSLNEVFAELINRGERIDSYEIGISKCIDIKFPDDIKQAEELFK